MRVAVAVANVREGAVIRPPADMADGDGRSAFARHLFRRAGSAPDVILLQEVVGTARVATNRLNEHPKAPKRCSVRRGCRAQAETGLRKLRQPPQR